MVIARAKADRFRGAIVDAARNAQIVVDQSTSPDEVAHGLYELAFVHIWSGDFSAERETLRRLASGVDALAGVRWLAWADWLLGCLDIYDNAPDSALVRLRRAGALFRDDALRAGEVSALTVSLTAMRMQDHVEFINTRRELRQLRGCRGWTSYTDSSIRHEDGEWARLRGELAEASRELGALYDESGSDPVHRAIACLSLAELARQEGVDGEAMRRECEAVADRHQLKFVTAHVAISDFLAGALDTDTAMQRIGSLGVKLATRHGATPTSPSDFCLGSRPDIHQIFFP